MEMLYWMWQAINTVHFLWGVIGALSVALYVAARRARYNSSLSGIYNSGYIVPFTQSSYETILLKGWY